MPISVYILIGGQYRVVVKRQLRNDKDVGSNPGATRNENGPLGDPLHRRWPNGLDRISVVDQPN